MASPRSLAVLQLLVMVLIPLYRGQSEDLPNCEEPCACFGDFNDSDLNALFPGPDSPSYTTYPEGLYVEVESRVLCGGQLISADLCVFLLLQATVDGALCTWAIQMGLFRLLNNESYFFVEGSSVGMEGNNSEVGFAPIPQCFLNMKFNASTLSVEPGDLLAIQIQLGPGCTVFPFYTTSDTSTIVYYQPVSSETSFNQLSPIPASSIANTSNHQTVRVNARLRISTNAGCTCEPSSTPLVTSDAGNGGAESFITFSSTMNDEDLVPFTTDFATSAMESSAMPASPRLTSMPLPSSAEESRSSSHFSSTSTIAMPISSFSSQSAGSISLARSTYQVLSSPMLLPGSTAADSIRESLSPTPSFNSVPSQDVTIPTYGAALAIIGTALLSLVFMTLILVPIYLCKKKRSKARVYEDAEVSRHSDRSTTSPLSTIASYREPVDALGKVDSTSHNGGLRLTIRNRIYSDTNHYPEELDSEATHDSEFTNGSVPFGERFTDHSYAILESNEEVLQRRPSLPPRTGDRFRTDSDQQAKKQQYLAPASREDELKLQLRRLAVKEIRPDKLRVLNEELGTGHFGVVNRGVWSVGDEEREVAVKSLTDNSTEKRIQYLQEAAIMGQFKHPSIVTLYGVITASEPPLIVVEILAKGDLKKYLNSLRPQAGQILHSEYTGLLLSFCRQVAAGMAYLSTRGFIHRDLAARNILISEEDVCKIADFGMARHLQDKTHYRMSSTGKIPVRWTAPEVVLNHKYGSSCDVWSFGILMYEIWSLGAKPYSHITETDEVLRIVNSGYRLPPPPGCPKTLYQMMVDCWNPRAGVRPDFAKVLQSLQRPDHKLLTWTPEDVAAYREQARTLGAPLEAGEELFKELQILYFS